MFVLEASPRSHPLDCLPQSFDCFLSLLDPFLPTSGCQLALKELQGSGEETKTRDEGYETPSRLILARLTSAGTCSELGLFFPVLTESLRSFHVEIGRGAMGSLKVIKRL